MRYLDSILTRRVLLNTDSYEKNKYVVKKFDYINDGLFHRVMHRELYNTQDKMLMQAIKILEKPFLYLVDCIKRVSNIHNYMIQ